MPPSQYRPRLLSVCTAIENELGGKLEKERLTWTDIEPIIHEMDDIEDIFYALRNPGGFLLRLANSTGSAARLVAMKKLLSPVGLASCFGKVNGDLNALTPLPGIQFKIDYDDDDTGELILEGAYCATTGYRTYRLHVYFVIARFL